MDTLPSYQQILQQTWQAYPALDKVDLQYALASVLGVNLSYLRIYAHNQLTQPQLLQWQSIIDRLCRHEPLAYILQERAFYKLNLFVCPDVLIPRPDTEILVEQVLARVTHQTPLALLDLGTGSGAIALSLALEKPHWQITATDISAKALAVAQENAKRHELQQVRFLQGAWFEALPVPCTFDVIVSNPPYIAPDDAHLAQLTFEPIGALVAAQNGLADLAHIIQQSCLHLTPNGMLFLEHGFDQAQPVQALFAQHGYTDITTIKDYGGNDRVTYAVWHG